MSTGSTLKDRRETDALAGRRIVVTRPVEQAGPLVHSLQGMGAEVVLMPVLEIVPPSGYGPLDSSLHRLDTYDWVVFGSANAVRFASQRYSELGLAWDAWRRVYVAAVGEATQRALERLGVSVHLVPERTEASGVVRAMGERGVRGQAVLLPQARQGRPDLQEGLRRLGANVTRVEAYDSRMVRPPADDVRSLCERGWDGVTFTSPSTVRYFVQIVEEAGGTAQAAPAFCIGNVTAREARGRGFDVKGVAEKSSAKELAAVVAAHFRPSEDAAGDNPADREGQLSSEEDL